MDITISLEMMQNLLDHLIDHVGFSNKSSDYKKGAVHAYRVMKVHFSQWEEDDA